MHQGSLVGSVLYGILVSVLSKGIGGALIKSEDDTKLGGLANTG